MGGIASGYIARRRRMEQDAGRKQLGINMASKECDDLVIFDFNHFCNNSFKDSHHQPHSDNIYLYSFPYIDIISM